jgi:hypothetical protein
VDSLNPRAIIQRKRAPSGYGSVSKVAGASGKSFCTCHQIMSGQAAKHSSASPKKTQPRMSAQRFKRGPLHVAEEMLSS